MSNVHYVLQIRAAQGPVYEHPLHDDTLTIGRQPDNDVILDHELIAGQHLRIAKAAPGAPTPCTVMDLGGRGDAVYQGQRLPPGAPVALRLMEPVTLGPYTLRLVERAAPSAGDLQTEPSAPPKVWLRRLALAGFAVALCSLLLNIVLMVKLGQVAVVGREVITEATDALDTTRAEGRIALDVDIAPLIPISVSVPIDQQFDAHVQYDLVLDEIVQTEVTIPVINRQVTLDIPIRATIPLDLVIPVHVQETLDFNEEITVDATVPIDVDTEALGLTPLLEKIEGWLARLRRIF